MLGTRSSSTGWLALAFVGLVALTFTPRTAHAQEASATDTEARLHFEAARSHFERGAYEEALREFQAAYELSHRADLLYNLYLCAERIGELDQAIDYLDRYLHEGAPAADLRTQLEARLVNMHERRDARQAQTAQASDDTASQTPPPPATTTRPGDIVPAAIAFGVAGAGLLTFAIFGGLALAEDGSLASSCGTSCSDAQLANLGVYVAVADAGWITAAVGAAAGLVLLFTVGMPSEQATSTALVLPWVDTQNGGGGLTLRGSF
ncbi:MAG: tetratricopeptide repeat protein [Sandaracinus sp.]